MTFIWRRPDPKRDPNKTTIIIFDGERPVCSMSYNGSRESQEREAQEICDAMNARQK